MYLVYLDDGPGKVITVMKCHQLPVDLNGKELPLVAKFPLKEEEFLLPLKDLERLYPYAEAGQSTEMEEQDITWKGHPSISDI
jgi:hypothetical protein